METRIPTALTEEAFPPSGSRISFDSLFIAGSLIQTILPKTLVFLKLETTNVVKFLSKNNTWF